MNSIKKTVLVLILAVVGAAAGFGYSFDCWTGMTGDGVIAINPFIYAPAFNPFTLSADIVGAYGFSANVDLFVNVATIGFLPSLTYGGSWAMLRVDLGGSNILALQAGTASVSPQYHLFLESDVFAFEANVYVRFTYLDLAHPAFGAYLAPVLKLSPFAFYCEVDPAYTLNGAFTLGVGLGDVLTAITPGVYVSYLFLIPTKSVAK
jgi:hypothetical protein